MHEPNVRHFYVKLNDSFVHLAQYGHNQAIIGPPSPSNKATTNPNQSSSSSYSNASLSTGVSGAGSVSSPLLPACSSLLGPDSSSISRVKKLVIFIPGNPGLLGVYHDFLVALYKTLAKPSDEGSDNPVILAISHNNFDHPDHCNYRASERICIEENELTFVERSRVDQFKGDPHHVELQVLNKLIILNRLLKVDLKRATPDGSGRPKLVLVGHSLGGYIILRLLQDRQLAAAHVGSVLIHPALENLKLTEKGSTVARLFTYKADYLMRATAFLFEKLLPWSTKLRLTKWHCSPEFVRLSSDIVIESIAQIASSKHLEALIYMAKSELLVLKDLDHEKMIEPHASKLRLIYTKGDHWVNDANRIELSKLYPNLHIEEQETLHAFIMDPDVVMNYAIKTGMFIQDWFE